MRQDEDWKLDIHHLSSRLAGNGLRLVASKQFPHIPTNKPSSQELGVAGVPFSKFSLGYSPTKPSSFGICQSGITSCQHAAHTPDHVLGISIKLGPVDVKGCRDVSSTCKGCVVTNLI